MVFARTSRRAFGVAAATLGLGLGLGFALGGGPALAQQEAVRIGTSSAGSANYTLGVGVSKLMFEHGGINATAEPVGGSSANLFALQAGKVEFAYVNVLSAYDAMVGNAPFDTPVAFGVIARGEDSFRQLIVSQKSGIETPADLAGKRIVGIRPSLPEIEMVTNAVLTAYGLSKDQVQIVSTTTSGEAIEALTTGAVDAIVLPASPHAANVAALAQDLPIRFISFPEDKMKVIMENLSPAMGAGEIPAGMYPGQDTPVATPVLGSDLVAAEAVPEEVAYKMAKAIFEHTEEFAAMQASAAYWTAENALADPRLPYHPGAIRYFKEIGLWTEALQAQQDALLKR